MSSHGTSKKARKTYFFKSLFISYVNEKHFLWLLNWTLLLPLVREIFILFSAIEINSFTTTRKNISADIRINNSNFFPYEFHSKTYFFRLLKTSVIFIVNADSKSTFIIVSVSFVKCFSIKLWIEHIILYRLQLCF